MRCTALWKYLSVILYVRGGVLPLCRTKWMAQSHITLLYWSLRCSWNQPPACTAAAHLLISSPAYIKGNFPVHVCQVLLLSCCTSWVIHVSMILVAYILPADPAAFACLFLPASMFLTVSLQSQVSKEAFDITCSACCVFLAAHILSLYH